ncbi:MAG: carboxypeptidase regulatory-like domain-containing protein [Acidobacteria bacterium]|nr:carboxypeptidase regulatory-like domain-containing protein [Acidobacteriota bacterium]
MTAGLLSVAGAGASVEVRGTIEGQPNGRPLEVSLVRAPTLYELLSTVLRDEPDGFREAEATVPVSDGRFVLDVAEPGARWVRVQGGGTAPRTYLLVGPETDTLLPPLELGNTASCSLRLVEPGSAWVARGRSLRDLRFSRSWSMWPPLRQLQAGRTTSYEFEAGRSRRTVSGVQRDAVAVTIGAPGYEPKVVDCLAGTPVAVELERRSQPIADGVLRRAGVPVSDAILIHADGWPAGTTDELGRYRVPAGAYQVLDTDGGLDGVELNGGVAELNASAPQPVAVTLTGAGRGRDELPTVAVVHWSSSGVPLASHGGRPESAMFLVAAGPGVSRTTVLAERFHPLRLTWSERPANESLEPLLRIRGVALDMAGDPVGGAQVVASGYGGTAGPAGVSDAAGRFLLEVAEPPDRRWLVASAPGYRETRTKLSDALSRTGPEQLVVELRPVRAIVGRLVSARSGSGVPGKVALARLWVSDRFVGEASTWNLEDPSLLQFVSTDEAGRFRLDPPDQDDVRLVAAAAGHGTVRRPLPKPLPGDAGDQQLGDVVLELETVLRGRVMDDEGAPVADAAVDFGSGGSGGWLPAGSTGDGKPDATTDASGGFRIGGLVPGDVVSLRIQAAGFVTERVSPVRVDAATEAEVLEVRLRTAYELAGRVTDESTGEGVEARLRFQQTVRYGGGNTESDPDGEFVLSGFPAGAGVLTVRADGYDDLDRVLAELPRSPLDLVLRPKAEIEVPGVVVRDGAPVPGASVSIRSAVSVTDAAGRFAVRAPVGPATVECRVPGLERIKRRQVDVVANMGEITIDVTPVTVRGRVTGPDGVPVSGASVDARPQGRDRFIIGYGGGDAQTGQDGGFEFQIDPGLYSLSARTGGSGGPEVEMSVAAGDRPYVELEVPQLHLVRVRVLGLTASEAAEVVVSLRAIWEEGASMSMTLINPTGGTDLEPVFETEFHEREGATMMATASAAGRTRRAPIRYSPSGVADVEISFAAGGGDIEGTVTLDGWPLAGESVHVRDERRGLTWSVRSDHRGRFLIDGLRAGAEVAVAAVGQQRAIRVTDTAVHVDLEATSAAVRGRLFDGETGLPVAGMRVSAVPAQSAAFGEIAAASRRVMHTRTAEDGSFVLDGLFSAPYRLEVRPGGSSRTSEDTVGSADVDLSAGDADVTLSVRVPADR